MIYKKFMRDYQLTKALHAKCRVYQGKTQLSKSLNLPHHLLNQKSLSPFILKSILSIHMHSHHHGNRATENRLPFTPFLKGKIERIRMTNHN